MAEVTQSGSSFASSEPSSPAASGQPTTFPARFEGVRELARGGMGRVLVAFDRLHLREVAIKESLDPSEAAMARFAREGLLSARLQHPGVVPVYELARRPTGEPYLVMRRVHGQALKVAIAEATTLPARLRLVPRLTAVAETMAYAHQQGVLHRDLKPSNVLLGEFGETVIIDWGLAKDLAVDEPAQPVRPAPELAELTATGAVMGTLAYMSPEQAAGQGVDARTDVYALGAMLYELLAGAPPHRRDTGAASRRLDARPLAEVAPDTPAELLTIVSRAMASAPDDRYPDARGLALDLQAFQTGRLVASHAYSTGALIRRWARQNARLLAVGASSLALLALVGGLSVRRVLAERDRANREAAAAQRVSDFMTQMFAVVDPSEARGNAVTAREILDRASKGIEQGLGEDPELRARLMRTMGEVYLSLGLHAPSEALLTSAATALQALKGDDHPETLRTRGALARLLFARGKFKDSEQLARDVLARQTRVLGADAPDTLTTLDLLGDDLGGQSHRTEAEAAHRQAYAARSRVLGSEARPTLVSLGRVGDDLNEQGKYVEAAALFQDLLARRTRALGPDDLDTVAAMNGLSISYQRLGRHAEAEKLDTDSLAVRTRVLGPEHPTTLESMLALGNDHFDRGDYQGAERLFAAVQDARTRVLGPEHLWTLGAMNNRADALSALGRLDEAEALHRTVLEVRKRVLGPDHRHVLLEKTALAIVLCKQKRFPEARALLLEARADRLRVLGPDDQGLGGVAYVLATIAAEEGKPDEAFAQLDVFFAHDPSPDDLADLPKEPAFRSLHADPRWAAVAAKVPR